MRQIAQQCDRRVVAIDKGVATVLVKIIQLESCLQMFARADQLAGVEEIGAQGSFGLDQEIVDEMKAVAGSPALSLSGSGQALDQSIKDEMAAMAAE